MADKGGCVAGKDVNANHFVGSNMALGCRRGQGKLQQSVLQVFGILHPLS